MHRQSSNSDSWKTRALAPLALLLLGLFAVVDGRSAAQRAAAHLGEFTDQTDVGVTPRKGSAEYDAVRKEYRVRGGGENMWERKDAFHYVWRRASGDMTLTADVRIIGDEGEQHRKAGWVIRQSLAPDSAYVSAVVHGDGLTSMQFREHQSDETREVRSSLSKPLTLHLDRRGNTFTLAAAMEGGGFETAGSAEVVLRDPVYIGLAVCSHDAAALETALFGRVSIVSEAASDEHAPVESKLEIISVDGKERKVIYSAPERFEAPNWSRDGKFLLFNRQGRLYTIPVSGGTPKLLDTGSAKRCNNDHGFSPDGKLLAISNSPYEYSLIYILAATGGEPRLITPYGPSYWHGWSPDGKTLAYCASRDGKFDVYTIPAEGGEERRLTDAEGLDDGPDYSPDGKYIYFNSERTGLMQIWRMRPDGSAQEQVTNDGFADWFAHPSPDGKWLVFLSFDKSVKGHPPNKDVTLRLMPAAGGKPRVLAKLFGGQGTINVPSWSPDSKRLAFVSYRLLK